ncbi:MAG: tRNA (adenine(22)-N(1))-methyltransferase [Bacillota bacterium]
MLQLSPRLQAIIELIVPDKVLADVGTDHAYVPVSAVLSGIVPQAIASDINLDPIRAAQETIVQNGLVGLIEVRHGPGLNVLSPGEAGTIVIAGMGGTTICTILAAGMDTAREACRLVIQPMVRIAETRAWLVDHGFVIVDERMAKEGRHLYQIIAAEPGASPHLTSLELEYGPVLLRMRAPLLRELLSRDLAITEAAINGLKKAAVKQPRLAEFIAQQQRITEALNEW